MLTDTLRHGHMDAQEHPPKRTHTLCVGDTLAWAVLMFKFTHTCTRMYHTEDKVFTHTVAVGE